MNKRRRSPSTLLAAVIIAIILVAGGYWIHSGGNQKTTTSSSSAISPSTTTSSQSYTTLSPASVPPKVAECSQAVSYASNGVPGPIQCANGDLNTADWKALAALEPKVLSLGYRASIATVQATLCSDVKANISNPIELTAYQIATIYYGWSFSSNPSVVITNGSCQNIDD